MTDPFDGADLLRERRELEAALGRYDETVPDDVIARMRQRLNTIYAQLVELGVTS